ncbi:sterol desaturase family protein [Arsukibacterium ikkense]|uniref:sterol desaturase family protein n=1 Tax=Arsukibacterium ikkense TaxID=336831 RepID=UPI00069A0367|nr:sterol desaturase family protein [Arsukibacterium ikkense]
MPHHTAAKLLKPLIARLLLPLAVAASLGLFFTGRARGLDLELLVSGSAVCILLVAMLLERWLPFAGHWNQSQHDSGTDLFSAAVLLALLDPLLKYLSPLVVVALYQWLDLSGLYSKVLGQAPFALQLLLVTLMLEFCRYWVHRWHHSQQWLWLLHAMHHSSQRLYALNNFRFHPLNYLLLFMLSTLPLMLLGVPAELLLGYLALTLPVVMLQHANIDLRSGVLNYLFSTNELHRWHHSANAAEANCNYGHALIIWDQLFGTFKYQPGGSNLPTTVGLFSSSSQNYPVTASYLAQLRLMYGLRCC